MSYAEAERNPNSEGTGALVCGILSLVSPGPIGLVLGIVGLALSKKPIPDRPREGSLQGGFICSLIGTILSAVASLVFCVLITFYGALVASFFQGAGTMMEEQQAREKVNTEALAKVRLNDSQVVPAGQGIDAHGVFSAEIENAGDHAIRQVGIEISFEGATSVPGSVGPMPELVWYEVHVPAGERRRLLTREVEVPPGWNGRFHARVTSVLASMKPEDYPED